MIGILSAVALPQYQRAADKARVQEFFVLGKHFKNAEELYRLSNGAYTDDFSELGTDFPSGGELSADHKTYSVKNGSYSLLTNIDRVLMRYRRGGVSITLSFMLDSLGAQRWCCAYQSDGYAGTGLCQSLGGQNPRAACITAGESGCRCYDLP